MSDKVKRLRLKYDSKNEAGKLVIAEENKLQLKKLQFWNFAKIDAWPMLPKRYCCIAQTSSMKQKLLHPEGVGHIRIKITNPRARDSLAKLPIIRRWNLWPIKIYHSLSYFIDVSVKKKRKTKKGDSYIKQWRMLLNVTGRKIISIFIIT